MGIGHGWTSCYTVAVSIDGPVLLPVRRHRRPPSPAATAAAPGGHSWAAKTRIPRIHPTPYYCAIGR